MVSVKVTGGKGFAAKANNNLANLIKKIADETHMAASNNTPVKTGYARSQWKKKVTSENFEVSNKVPYIQRLEAGASKIQAPRGIIGPTLEQIKGKV